MTYKLLTLASVAAVLLMIGSCACGSLSTAHQSPIEA